MKCSKCGRDSPEIIRLTSKGAKSYLTQFIMNLEQTLVYARKMLDAVDKSELSEFEATLQVNKITHIAIKGNKSLCGQDGPLAHRRKYATCAACLEG